jgi:hypothetical protein
MNPNRLEKLDKKTLIGFILKKDEMIAHLESRQKGLEYVGRIFLKDRFYGLYIREEVDDTA